MINIQKAIAAVMILGSSLLATQILDDFAFPGILCMLGLLGLSRRFIWTIRPQRQVLKSLLYLLLLVIFAVHYRYGGTGPFAPTATMAWQTVTRYFLAAMILVLYLGSTQILPTTLALFQLAFCISVGQILLIDEAIVVYRGLELAGVLLTTLFVVTSQPTDTPPITWHPYRSRRAVLALTGLILITLNFGWILGSLMYQRQGRINFLSSVLWGERLDTGTSEQRVATVGFSASGYISNILNIIDDPDQEPVLTITGDENPNYLRARAFDNYHDSEWSTSWSTSFDYPYLMKPWSNSLPDTVPLPGRNPVFRVTDREATQWKRLHIQQRLDQPRVLFTPLGCGYIEIQANQLRRDQCDIVYGPRMITQYSLAYDNSGYSQPPSDSLRQNMLSLPSNLEPGIRALAQRVLADQVSAQDKIKAVIAHFRNNYTYFLGMEYTPNVDPVTRFLLEGTTGYCEYFATGAALLLRLGNVPTRYVTGFAVTERDAKNGTWIVRNAHAHAWTEAWDEDTRTWVLVEATVQDGDALAALDVQLLGQRPFQEFLDNLTQVFYEYGFMGAVVWLLGQLGWWVWVPVLGVAALIWRWYCRTHRQTRGEPSPAQALILILHRALRRMDRRVRGLGYQRAPHETLHCFAERLGAPANSETVIPLANWYRSYANLRYQRHLTPEAVAQLLNNLPKHR